MTSPLEQKKIKIAGPVVVTANRTGDGAVVYRAADGVVDRPARTPPRSSTDAAARAP